MNSSSSPARREDWKTVDMPQSKARLHFERIFSAEDYSSLARGLIPQQMEDKWFIFLDQNRLCFHRSWVGFCIYEVFLRPEEDSYVVDEAFANRDPNQYNQVDPDYDVRLLNFLIDNLLLGKMEPFPIPAGLPRENWAIYQHHIAGTAYPEQEPDEGRP